MGDARRRAEYGDDDLSTADAGRGLQGPAEVGHAAESHGCAAFFDPRERTVAIEGDVEDLLYANPHVVIKMRAPDAVVYTVTWQAVTWAERNAGVTKSTLRVGDHLIVAGAPSRNPASRDVTMVRAVRRPRDRWIWRSQTPFAPPR
jgi:hypothetical protein